jgi:AraC family transcriptional regulator of adaptative response/methylated-DNA-[protein]-cysteine methyltransferase
VCALSFIHPGGWDGAVDELSARWPNAQLQEQPGVTVRTAERIFAGSLTGSDRPLSLYLKGTNFQLRVWEALLRIPLGAVSTYGDLARTIGSPSAGRAVGGAVAENPLAFLIPCHRVIRSSGALSNYRWGATRKRAMLGWESAQRETTLGMNDVPPQ